MFYIVVMLWVLINKYSFKLDLDDFSYKTPECEKRDFLNSGSIYGVKQRVQ